MNETKNAYQNTNPQSSSNNREADLEKSERPSSFQIAIIHSFFVAIIAFGIPLYAFFSPNGWTNLWLQIIFMISDFTENTGMSETFAYTITGILQTLPLVLLGIFVALVYVNRSYIINEPKKTLAISTGLFSIFSLLYYLYTFALDFFPDDISYLFDPVEFTPVVIQLLGGIAIFYFFSRKKLQGLPESALTKTILKRNQILQTLVVSLLIYIGLIFVTTGVDYFRFLEHTDIQFQVDYNRPDIEEHLSIRLLSYLPRFIPYAFGIIYFWLSPLLIDVTLIAAILYIIQRRKIAVFRWIWWGAWLLLVVGIGVYVAAEIHYSRLAYEDKGQKEEYYEQYFADQDVVVQSDQRFLYIQETDQYTRKLVVSDIGGGNLKVLREIPGGVYFISPGGSYYLEKHLKGNTPEQYISDWDGNIKYRLSDEPWVWAWSPNERYIVSQSRRVYGRPDIPAVVQLHDTHQKRTIQLPGVKPYEYNGDKNYNNKPLSFAWSDDSKKLFFNSKDGIMVVNNIEELGNSLTAKPSVGILPNFIPCAELVYLSEALYCAVNGDEIDQTKHDTTNDYLKRQNFFIIKQGFSQKNQTDYRIINLETPIVLPRTISPIDENYLFVATYGHPDDDGMRDILDLMSGKFIKVGFYSKKYPIFQKGIPQRYFEPVSK